MMFFSKKNQTAVLKRFRRLKALELFPFCLNMQLKKSFYISTISMADYYQTCNWK